MMIYNQNKTKEREKKTVVGHYLIGAMKQKQGEVFREGQSNEVKMERSSARQCHAKQRSYRIRPHRAPNEGEGNRSYRTRLHGASNRTKGKGSTDLHDSDTQCLACKAKEKKTETGPTGPRHIEPRTEMVKGKRSHEPCQTEP